ncbi:hypothetical protein [Frigidibacter sp. MR17.24]|uniref:hypothetical protein n=1 Tax=Frigidibacter sp. MR17.24 TaxID=3127345 RepID=UPI0030130A47
MPTPFDASNELMGKIVVASDGEAVGMLDSVAQEADNRIRLYITRTKAMGGGTFSIVAPENYVSEGDIDNGMSSADVKVEM